MGLYGGGGEEGGEEGEGSECELHFVFCIYERKWKVGRQVIERM